MVWHEGKVGVQAAILSMEYYSLDICIVWRYTDHIMIKSFRHKGLEKFFRTGSKAGIQPKHATKLQEQLTLLDAATSALAMAVPGWEWHPLKGELADHYAVSVNGNWRLTFAFDGEDAVLVDYQDYHGK